LQQQEEKEHYRVFIGPVSLFGTATNNKKELNQRKEGLVQVIVHEGSLHWKRFNGNDVSESATF